ncbi:MAG TPA: response regulator transcription factor [Nitrospira sp.]|jgi:DNA-binding NarL/FixJ family response regulator|nr:response regulator transcription factor [Nitrospira sp.]
MRAVIGSDHDILLLGLCRLVEGVVEIAGRVTDCRALLTVISTTKPELVILDVERSGFGWLRATERIRGCVPNIVVACISASRDHNFLEEMASIGAITKPLENQTIQDLQNFVAELIGERSPSIPARMALPRLTLKESQVLRRVADGITSRRIADEFRVSVRTVEFHRSNIMRKLGARSVSDLVRYTIQNHGPIQQATN